MILQGAHSLVVAADVHAMRLQSTLHQNLKP
jgi:hypothetical protein